MNRQDDEPEREARPRAPRLRIWQQNLRKSESAQQNLINTENLHNEYDLLMIQEPYADFRRLTRTNAHFHAIYPTNHFSAPTGRPPERDRALILVNVAMKTDTWKQIDFPSSDVVVVQIQGSFGKLTLFNIYNDCEHSHTV
ncbi:hypothetical protein K488DRAFT_65609, partial [Vararia minispora EC-137]